MKVLNVNPLPFSSPDTQILVRELPWIFYNGVA